MYCKIAKHLRKSSNESIKILKILSSPNFPPLEFCPHEYTQQWHHLQINKTQGILQNFTVFEIHSKKSHLKKNVSGASNFFSKVAILPRFWHKNSNISKLQKTKNSWKFVYIFAYEIFLQFDNLVYLWIFAQKMLETSFWRFLSFQVFFLKLSVKICFFVS